MLGRLQPDGSSSTLGGRLRDLFSQTAAASRGALLRRDSGAVFIGVSAAYLVLFLFILENLAVVPGVGLSIEVVDAPLTQMLRPAPGAFLFEPIALLQAGVVVWEFSPLNTVSGLSIALLVGVNLSVSYLAITQPRACGMSTGAGVLASLPALLAGSACCAPVIFLVVGIQVTGTLITAFSLLLPVSIFLLIATLIYVSGKISPTALAG